MRDPRRAYRVVDAFEDELADYCAAPFAVTVSSCTNALLLSLVWAKKTGDEGPIGIPKHTYIGVLQSALNAGYEVDWSYEDEYEDWQEEDGFYVIYGTDVIDAARKFGPHYGGNGIIKCLSFHSAKQLPLGRGGAILTDNDEAAEWFRAARMDGRPPGENRVIFPGYHCPMPPDVAARGLDILSRWNDKGYSPPPLPHEDYLDLSEFYP